MHEAVVCHECRVELFIKLVVHLQHLVHLLPDLVHFGGQNVLSLSLDHVELPHGLRQKVYRFNVTGRKGAYILCFCRDSKAWFAALRTPSRASGSNTAQLVGGDRLPQFVCPP